MERAKLTLFAMLLLLTSNAFSNNEFEQYKRDGLLASQSIAAEFVDYQKNYLKEFNAYKSEILNVWDKADVSSEKSVVQYSDDYKNKSKIDFIDNSITISIRDSVKTSAKEVSKQVESLVVSSIESSSLKDKLLSSIGVKTGDSKSTVVGAKYSGSDINKMLSEAQMVIGRDSKGSYKKITVKLPEGATFKRAHALLPKVKNSAKEFNVDAALIYAVIHTESSFNPMAQSHIPAFGLMQIVPTSAGKDVHKFLTGRNSTPSESLLLSPSSNIRYGTAYLHLLDTKYLSRITDPVSRLHCVIAAYNTGAGNVARAFTGNTSIKSAAKRINSMTSEEVYNHLTRNLKYKEARDYLRKVHARIKIYS